MKSSFLYFCLAAIPAMLTGKAKGRKSSGEKHSSVMLMVAAKGERNGAVKYPVGERHWKSKLTQEIVAEIKSRKLSGERTDFLASEFKIVNSTVNRIASGKAWSHIT